ncbi:acyl-CoA dehydrogenase [Sphingomonas corticis]|jgi:alkylation response protein AidB-like acyl-CoA dehydrogenase|uniref:Acyl-CoA dehydrogenase n=1 Tax=Sphingomonas corticis TaxID=2722791 RepID=A0ABX1CKY7_9SPHN|nr:acyl-CoA dehydrogenase [Sphingomonas corticis]NJR77836.1 acyl-CoA dehydrogenase [Sphingomonas corticis]
MTYAAPVAEQRFVLDQLAGLGIEPDMLDAVLEGAAQLAEGEWAPLARIGDTQGPRLTDDGVRMPAGYREAYRAYVEGGWGTIGVEEAHGGQGLPFVVQAAVLETLGSANMGFALAPILTVGAIEALSHHGSPEQQATYLPRLATGEWTGTMNLTEPQAGSDVGALRATATPRGDGTYTIRGTKIFISFGDHDLTDNIVHLVLARTPDAPVGTRGISLFLVPKVRLDGTPNDVRVVSIEHKMGLHASPTCVLAFGEEGECVGELIGPEFGGMRAMFTMMNNARLNVGLQGVQVAEAATQKAAAFARERVQGAREGGPSAIVAHPDVRRMLMRMRAQTAAARALVYYSCAQVGRAEARDRLEIMTPLAKAHATDLGNEVASLGIQVHGGMGFIEETGAAQFFRDARITPIYEGTNGIQAADLVGRKLSLSNGAAFAALIDDMRREAEAVPLVALVDACERVGRRLQTADADDRLAASYPFLTMLSVAASGWLLERLARAGDGNRRAVTAFYLDQIVPEALGLEAAATAPASQLYALSAEDF